MSAEKQIKINQLLRLQPPGAVFLSAWLTKQDYSLGLLKRYRNSHWLESIGTGAMIRAGDSVNYEGAIYALQNQAGLTIHPGGRTALSLQGNAHYLELSTKKVVLFGGSAEKLPIWFKNHDWGLVIDYHPTSFLPPDLGMLDLERKFFSLKVSSPVRALMECLYLAPEKQELLECYELMEGLNNVRPQVVQSLLEACRSVKVKRLFLYLAEKAGHDWMNYLNLENMDLGSGKRSIVENGVYIPKYQITVPKALEGHGKSI
jgi:hypothetical protein